LFLKYIHHFGEYLKNSNSDELELLFLGTGNAFSMADRYFGSILVNNKILLDASPIVVPHMKVHKRNLTKLEHILITHFHGDHFFGLPFILLDYAYLEPLPKPLSIIGPTHVQDLIVQLTNMGFPGLIEKLKGRAKLNFFEIDSAGDYETFGLKFQVHTMDHGNSEAYGYQFTISDKTIAYTGDTNLCKSIYDLAEGADVLIIEMSNPYKDVPGHMSLEKLNILQDNLNSDVKIILNHIGKFEDDFQPSENVIVPKDGQIFKF